MSSFNTDEMQKKAQNVLHLKVYFLWSNDEWQSKKKSSGFWEHHAVRDRREAGEFVYPFLSTQKPTITASWLDASELHSSCSLHPCVSRFIINVVTDWSHGATVSNIKETKALVVSLNRDVAAKKLQIRKTTVMWHMATIFSSVLEVCCWIMAEER